MAIKCPFQKFKKSIEPLCKTEVVRRCVPKSNYCLATPTIQKKSAEKIKAWRKIFIKKIGAK